MAQSLYNQSGASLPATIKLRNGQTIKIRWKYLNKYQDTDGSIYEVYMPILPTQYVMGQNGQQYINDIMSNITRRNVETGRFETYSLEDAVSLLKSADKDVDTLLEEQRYNAFADTLISKGILTEGDLRYSDIEKYLDTQMNMINNGGQPNYDIVTSEIGRIKEDPTYYHKMYEGGINDQNNVTPVTKEKYTMPTPLPQWNVYKQGEVIPGGKLGQNDVVVASSAEEAAAMGAEWWVSSDDYLNLSNLQTGTDMPSGMGSNPLTDRVNAVNQMGKDMGFDQSTNNKQLNRDSAMGNIHETTLGIINSEKRNKEALYKADEWKRLAKQAVLAQHGTSRLVSI